MNLKNGGTRKDMKIIKCDMCKEIVNFPVRWYTLRVSRYDTYEEYVGNHLCEHCMDKLWESLKESPKEESPDDRTSRQ